MMNNMFSIFDPSTNIMNLPMNWISMLIGIFMIPLMYWFFPNRHFILWKFMFMKLHQELKTLIFKNNNLHSLTFLFISLFTYILFNNFLGLFPYIFTSTSHLSFTLSISVPLWLSFMLFGWINNYQHMFMHMIPQNTPNILMPFMVMIETISNIIRPGTLAVRLTANMIAGHLLLSLLSNSSSLFLIYFLWILILIQILLLTLESTVAIIQAYVITVLSTLYSSEMN